jgi:hypothetical protein
LVQKHANILASGLASWKVKWGIGETPDDAYYSLGSLADGSVVIRSLTRTGEYGENHTFAAQIEASAKMLCTERSTVLELLHNLGNAQLAHKITAINGKTFKGNFGTKWSFDSSADFNGHRFIQVTANHNFLTAHASLEDLADVLDTPAADGTADAGDVLYAWSAATKYPAGVTAFTVDPSGDLETIGKFRNARFMAECLGTTDEYGRYVAGNNIRITAEADMLQTADELAYLGANFPAIDACTLTLADGTTVTMSGNMRASWEYNLSGGAETMSFARLTLTKVIKSSEWAGILS